MINKYHEHYTSGFNQICEKGEIINDKKKITYQGYADGCGEPLYTDSVDWNSLKISNKGVRSVFNKLWKIE
ncbi:hypothetical protein H8D04_01235 [bacterium]|nr:hypothetical protein [bacterium]